MRATKNIASRGAGWLMVVAAVMAVAPVAASDATSTPTAGADLWDNPTFQKEFMGSYGFQAEIEPRVTTEERAAMEEVLPLLSSDPDAATERLLELATPEASAVFDFTLGNLCFQKEALDEAAEHYRTALEKFPSFRRAHKNLGLISVRQGQFEDALRSLSKVVELGGGNSLVYGLLGYSYSSLDQHVPAESAYRNAMLLDPGTLDWKLGLTQSVLEQQKYGEAIALCDELIAAYPERTDFLLLQANAYLGVDEPMKAAENYEIVRRMGKVSAQSMNTLGDIYVNDSLWDLAARSYSGAIDLSDGSDSEQTLRRVEVLAQRGALPQARELLQHLQKSPGAGELDASQRKKLLKLEARIDVADGVEGRGADVLEEIVALDPLDGEALILLGQHYARLDETDQAIFYYERAEGISDFEAEAKIRHAQLLVSQTRYDEAVPLLRRAQEIDPREDIARYLEQVERAARTRR
jgi:tetratricopeptide (TPR) repeat protein